MALAITTIKNLNYVSVCNLAIRGGGHTPWAGSANINRGVTIDMRQINTVSVKGDRTQAMVGAGALWGDVHGAMDRVGLSIVGGRAASVGVGGLLTGGMNSI